MPRQSHPRIQATITGKGKTVGPVESHERNVLAISRRVVALEKAVKTLKRELIEAQLELRFKRRELRAVLQRDSTMGLDTNGVCSHCAIPGCEGDCRISKAGQADAIDAAEARREKQ